MSTLRINNIEAQSIPASPTLDEKVKITNSSGDILVNIDGKTSGITTIGINTTDGNIKFDENSNVVVTGIITATKFSGQFEPTSLTIGTGSSIFSPATNTLSFGTNSSEKVRIDSNGRMLLGTVKTYGTGPYYDDICINNSNGSGAAGGSGIDLISKSDNYGAIVFSNESQHERGYIKFEHNSGVNKLRFGTVGTDRWEILSGGHLQPSTNEVFDIGSSSNRVRNGYFDDLNIKGNVGIGNTTTVGRNAGVSTATGSLIYNTTTNALEVYNGSSWLSVTAKSGSFNISYLVIGGGGAGGGSFRGGGGGAGAYRTNYSTNSQGGGQSTGSAKTVTTGNAYSVVIGAGGAGVNGQNGNNGAQSKFDDITADGGGGGGKYITAANTNSGNGSGGGGGGQTGVTRAGGAGGTYGYAGGNGSNSVQCGGGGGGAASSGSGGGQGPQAGDGGSALASTISGASVLRAGGGGAGAYESGNNYPVGGGGGAGDGGHGYQIGKDATANTGSGGGGCPGASGQRGGNGGSGVVILRFNSVYTFSVSGGVTYSETVVGSDRLVTITATSTNTQTITFT